MGTAHQLSVVTRAAKIYFSEQEMAEILDSTIGTLRKNRCIGKNHPPFIKNGRKTLYPVNLFDQWNAAKRVISEVK